ncbi:MAG: SDR family oxidoreductase [Propionibacteriaceae bacterium]
MSRVAVVTGGGSGIGAGVALALARDGWQVMIAGRREEPLAATAASEPGLGLAYQLTDVTREPQVRHLFDVTLERFDRVDLLVNNAGTGAPARDIDEISLAEWQQVVDVNLTGMFLCAREAFRVMRHQDPQGGRIINNGSISAHAPRPKSVAYTATKHAVSGLTKSLSLDGRAYGISCGQIDIGNAATDLVAAMVSGTRQADGSTKTEPMMDVADVGRAVVYMAGLPPAATVLSMTVLATTMPFVGRG